MSEAVETRDIASFAWEEETGMISQKRLAMRWDVSTGTIGKYASAGVLHRLENLPKVFYSMDEVYKLEGKEKKPVDEFTKAKIRQLQKELRIKDKQIGSLKAAIAALTGQGEVSPKPPISSETINACFSKKEAHECEGKEDRNA